jgi:hypothetical protein
VREHFQTFLARKHHGQALRTLGSYHRIQPRQRHIQHTFVEKQQRGQGLRLSRRRDVMPQREVRQKGFHVLAPEFPGMTLAMKQNVAPDPTDVLLLGTVAVATEPDRVADVVEQARFMRHVHIPQRSV